MVEVPGRRTRKAVGTVDGPVLIRQRVTTPSIGEFNPPEAVLAAGRPTPLVVVQPPAAMQLRFVNQASPRFEPTVVAPELEEGTASDATMAINPSLANLLLTFLQSSDRGDVTGLCVLWYERAAGRAARATSAAGPRPPDGGRV
jgi:hypothetical protein